MSGVNTEINIFIYENNSTIVVNKKYIIETEMEKYIYTAVDDIPVKRIVKTGWQSGENIEIVQGLNLGDILITEGSKIVKDSNKIKIITGE
jgi:ribosome biogenesis protein Nip4